MRSVNVNVVGAVVVLIAVEWSILGKNDGWSWAARRLSNRNGTIACDSLGCRLQIDNAIYVYVQ